MFYDIDKNIRNKRKIIALIVIFALTFNLVLPIFSNSVNAAIYDNLPKSELRYDANDNSSVFPESYKQYIRNLKSTHPNWIFKALYTGLDWTESVRQESYEVKTGISTVSDGYSANWKKDGTNSYVDASFVVASKKAVAYTMDPRNFLNDYGIFQFEALDFSEVTNTKTTIEKVLAGTLMETYPTKYKRAGTWIDLPNGLNWAQIIINASKNAGGNGISSVFLASRMRQETGLDLSTNGSVNGSVAGYEGIYNFFNIGAIPSYVGAKDAVTNGLIYARGQGWTTPEASINAGATELWSSWIRWGQNTVYFQKFDVSNIYGNAKALYAYQYMTNILAPSGEARITYNAYANAGLLNSSFEFYIPVYDNMPNTMSPHPDSEETGNLEGTDIIYLDATYDTGVDDTFNIRSGPGTSYDIITTIVEKLEGAENRKKFVRTQVGTNGWDKIKLSDGREGYVSQSFVQVYNYTHVTSISLDKSTATLKAGENTTLNATISPSNAFIKNITWASSNNNVATVDSNGKITAKSVGTTDITVTTLDGNKVAKCTVTVVNTPATSISVGSSEYPVVIGNYLQVNPTISPDTTTNKSYDIVVEDTSIATVENGKIKGIKVGNTKVTLTTKDGSNKSCSFTLKVSENIATVKDYPVNSQGIISNVAINTNASTIKNKIETSYTKKILNSSGNEIGDSDKIGTGSKVQIISGGSVVQEYTIAVTGDLNGDAKSTASDYVLIKNYIMDTNNLNGAQMLAADMNKDSKITASDYVLVKNYIMQN